MRRIEMKFIKPCEMYGLLVNGTLDLKSVQNSRKDLIKNVGLSDLQTVKLSVQLEILHGNTSGILVEENKCSILIPKCWCVIYRSSSTNFSIVDNSFQITRNKSKDTVETYIKGKHKLVKCVISLLTQKQHLLN